MKPIGYLLTSLSVAGVLGFAVAAHSAEKTTTEKTAAAKTSVEETAADKPDCDQAREHHPRGHRSHGDDHADWRRHDGAPRDGGRAPFAKLLGLTDAQQKTLESAREKDQAASVELRDKALAAREALMKAGSSNASDEELNKLAANSAALRAQLELGHIKMHRQLLAVLTPEQKQKLTDWEANHKPEGRGRAPL